MRNKLTLLLIMAALLMTTVVSASPTVVVAKNPYKDPSKAFHYVYDLCVTKNSSGEWETYMLGSYYDKGYGTKPSVEKAYIWYKMSANHHYKPAVVALGKLEKSMSKKQINNAYAAYVKTRDASIARFMKDMKNM